MCGLGSEIFRCAAYHRAARVPTTVKADPGALSRSIIAKGAFSVAVGQQDAQGLDRCDEVILNLQRTSLLHDSALATTRAMQRSGVKRLVVLSAAAHFPGILNRIASFIRRNHMRDSLAMEAIVQGSGLAWTIARPPSH